MLVDGKIRHKYAAKHLKTFIIQFLGSKNIYFDTKINSLVLLEPEILVKLVRHHVDFAHFPKPDFHSFRPK